MGLVCRILSYFTDTFTGVLKYDKSNDAKNNNGVGDAIKERFVSTLRTSEILAKKII